jgi:hypothetical protein
MNLIGPRRTLPVLFAAAVAAVAAGCGPGAILTSETPDQAVTAALQAASTTPLRMSLSGDLQLDTSGLGNLPASIQAAISQIGSGGSATGQLIQENGARRQVTATAAGHSLTLVEYDGHGYVSQDGGAYAEVPAAAPSSPAAGSSQLGTAVADLSFQDQGPATVGQVSAERYSATITVSTLERLAQDLGGGGGSSAQLAPMLDMLAPYVSGSGTVDLWLSTADGGLVRAALTGSLTVNVGAAATALSSLIAPAGGSSGSLPTGSLGVSIGLNLDVSDYGGSVSVTKPDATSTLPASGGWSGWLGSSALLG